VTKRTMVGLCVYLGMVASAWVVQLVSPSSVPESEAEGLVFALVLGVGVCVRSGWGEVGGGTAVRAIGSGLLLFGCPSLLSVIPGGGLPSLVRVTLLAVGPVVVLLVRANREVGGRDFLGLLGAALAGLAGVVLLLPVDVGVLVRRPVDGLVFGVVVVAIGVGGYLGHQAAAGLGIKPLVVLLLGPSFLLLCLSGAVHPSNLSVPKWGDVWGLLWGVGETVLLVRLIRTVPPVALATRYLLVPLITVVEGFAVMRPQISGRMVAGMALVVLGSARLLLRGDGGDDSSVSLA